MKTVVTSSILDETTLKEFQEEVDHMNEDSCSVFEIIYCLNEHHSYTAFVTFEKGVAFIHIN